MKSGNTNRDGSAERDVTPVPNELSVEGELPLANSVMTTNEDALRNVNDFEDDVCFAAYMIKPSNLRDIWSTFKVKQAMLDYMTWYFRPKNSYDPERVDYNALNILAEYQTYNLEYLKNELDLNFDQCANVLQALWNLLEFDPDEKSIQVEHNGGAAAADADGGAKRSNGKEADAKIAYLGDDMFD